MQKNEVFLEGIGELTDSFLSMAGDSLVILSVTGRWWREGCAILIHGKQNLCKWLEHHVRLIENKQCIIMHSFWTVLSTTQLHTHVFHMHRTCRLSSYVSVCNLALSKLQRSCKLAVMKHFLHGNLNVAALAEQRIWRNNAQLRPEKNIFFL